MLSHGLVYFVVTLAASIQGLYGQAKTRLLKVPPDGHIWAYSEPGHGTTFKIYLPRLEVGVDSSPQTEGIYLMQRGTETVLLVEDEPSVRALSVHVLIEQGYTVLEASNDEEAMLIAGQPAGAHIDLLITDVVMPRMGGRVLADQLTLLRPEIKVLFTSGYTDDAIIHHSVLEPGTSFLQKPFTSHALTRKVREMLDAQN